MAFYPPTPSILQWLSAGQFANRFHRAVRLWVMLHRLYGSDAPWADRLPHPFAYGDLRDRLFTPGHPISETLKAQEMVYECAGKNCICGQSVHTLILENDCIPDPQQWITETLHHTGMSADDLELFVDECPFATVHRSIRDDLKLLGELGWLVPQSRGKYCCVPPSRHPTPPFADYSMAGFPQLSTKQLWDMMHGLEAIAFAQPSLEPIIQALWEHTHSPTPSLTPSPTSPLPSPQKRIFIDFDDILTEETRERVDTLQSEIEELCWQHSDGGVIQFDYWLAKTQKMCRPTVYPVCLHYTRRAKYLSAYGVDPEGAIAWHNYRLDRIHSDHLTVLAWGDPTVPHDLRLCRNSGTLPSPGMVQAALNDAWGFNFYLEKQLLIMRFSPFFAQEYVENTRRHPTFRAIAFNDIPNLVRHEVSDPMEQATLLQILQRKSPNDAYYCGWVRVGDMNVTMRLRDWRSNGEVIAPIALRQQMIQEAQQELESYGQ